MSNHDKPDAAKSGPRPAMPTPGNPDTSVVNAEAGRVDLEGDATKGNPDTQ